uniref:hypothetical protein n=1 Tax=Porodaedalea mongolica TaxID=2651638 RepID=UPI0021ACD770|nr:hypothetical protein NYK79_mgp16 [Porodaedalea mongolica]UUA03974.1 hypothetical protein [Porodaedalea mongolica]WCF76741.1 hypothetical protein [Porodaedalea mongolica]
MKLKQILLPILILIGTAIMAIFLYDLLTTSNNNVVNQILGREIKNLDEVVDLNNEGQKSMIFDLDSVLEYYNSFHAVSRIALTLLLFNYVIISCLISIIFIFYGDYLIQRFDLENKYPTIYKLVSLRVKYQRYYLIMNMSLIFIVLLLETLFCIIVINDFG